MKCRLRFIEHLLGTLSANKDVATEFILSKAPDGPRPDEVANLEEAQELLGNSTTIFPKENGVPFLWNYQVKGFFKDACEAMITSGEFTQEYLKKKRLTTYLYKKTIDHHLHISPRKITLAFPEGGKIGAVERPLRGQTMRGERICLAKSESVPAGTTCEIEIRCTNQDLMDMVEWCLDYGKLRGIGQWRNSCAGSFEFEVLQ